MKAFLSLLISPLLLAPLAKVAQAQTTPLAPPISVPSDSLWAWQDLPRNERVPIVRAVFDQGGYLLYDANGQVISVPFTGSNLYVMQFGRTSGEMCFVNEDGRTPTLYVPTDGYLENASVSGARWYPFPQRYFYTRPVFLGPAPSWDAYCNMGWYSSTVIYGGYWCNDPWRVGVTFHPMPGLYITVNGRSCHTWDDYSIYYRTAPVRPIIIVNQPSYRERVIVSRPERSYSYSRPSYRESSRPDYKAPARESEIRGQQSGYPGSRDPREQRSTSVPPLRERREPLPGRSEPTVREQRPSFNNDRTDRPVYTPPSRETRPVRESFPSRDSAPSRDTRPVRESIPPRETQPSRTSPPTREVSPSRDSAPSRDSGSSRESRSSGGSSSSRERERGKR